MDRYSDSYYTKEESIKIKQLLQHSAFSNFKYSSFDTRSYSVCFDENKIVPFLFYDIKYDNLIFAKLDWQPEKIRLLEELIYDVCEERVRKFNNPFINVYRKLFFNERRLYNYIEEDFENFYSFTDNRDFVSILQNDKNEYFLAIHLAPNKLFHKCIDFYHEIARENNTKQLKIRLDALNTKTISHDVKKVITNEISDYTIGYNLNYININTLDFIEDLKEIRKIESIRSYALLQSLNTTLKLLIPQSVSSQSGDNFDKGVLNINCKFLKTNQDSMQFNPATFNFIKINNPTEKTMLVPIVNYDKNKIKKDQTIDFSIFANYDVDNYILNNDLYLNDFFIPQEAIVKERYKPIFVFTPQNKK